MKTLSPDSAIVAPRSFLIYGEPKAGKTSLALSVAEAVPTLLIAAEQDGWQDAYQTLSQKGKDNLTVVTPETRSDLQNIASTIAELKPRVVIVDSLTEVMNFFEKSIKSEGGKNVNNGITQKLSLSAYGDLATLTIDFVRMLKTTGCHLIFTAGLDKERIENDSGSQVRYAPLFTGGKTGVNLPYELRAIAFLQNINGKRQLWFESTNSWVAGTNYKVLADVKMIEDPTFIKIFSLFPRPTAAVEAPKAKEKKAKKEVEVTTTSTDVVVPMGTSTDVVVEVSAEPPFLDELTPEGETVTL